MKRRGFTLIELLIVIAIIGILATIIVISYTNAQAKARDNKRKADLQAVSSAVEMYYADKKQYPYIEENRGYYRVRSVNDETKQGRWTDGFSASDYLASGSPGMEGKLVGYISIPMAKDPKNTDNVHNNTTWKAETAPQAEYAYTYFSTPYSYVLAARLEVGNDGNGSRFINKTLVSKDGVNPLSLDPTKLESMCSFAVPDNQLYFIGANLVKDNNCGV